MRPGGTAAAVLIILLVACFPAEGQDLGRAVRVVDPGGQALERLHDALRRAELGEGTARLLFYGASHTAPDLYTGFLRARLKERFGDGGAGFVLPVRPFAYYDHREVRIDQGGTWRTVRVHGRDRAPDAYGLAG